MKNNNIIVLSVLIATTSVVADIKIDALKERLTALENSKIKIQISGVIEVSYQNNRVVGETLVDKVGLDVDANLTQDLSANLVLKSSLDDNSDLLTNKLIDEATLNGDIIGIDFTMGKFGVPFGVYETALVSDTAGEGIGDTNINGVLLLREINDITFSVWSGNSENNGLSIRYKDDNFAFGVNTIRDAAADISGNATDIINNKGLAINGQATFGNITVIVEQIKVDADTASQENGKLTQVELSHTMGDWIFAVSQNKGTTTNGTKNDIKTNAYAVSYTIVKDATLTIESNKKKDEKQKRTTLAKLAYKF